MQTVLEAFTTPGHPAAFSGLTNLRRELGNKAISKTLEQINSYTIKREAKKPKHYNPYYIWEKRKHLQVDLIDFSSPKLKYLANANKYKFLFCAIDGFTRYAWVEPMKNKNERSCVKAFERILKKMELPPQRVVSDRGSEFTSAAFTNTLKKYGIKPIYVNFKAGIVERFQRSLQSLIYKYLKYTKNNTFINSLPALLQTYNSRYHRIIKMSPRDAEIFENRFKVRKALKSYYSKTKEKNPSLNLGDKVRVQRQKEKFSRGYDDIFTDEIYNISAINRSLPVPMYSLTTFDGHTELLANFYGNELQKVSGLPFKILEILKTEIMPQGITRHYAKVKVNNKQYFAWVNKKDVENVIAN